MPTGNENKEGKTLITSERVYECYKQTVNECQYWRDRAKSLIKENDELEHENRLLKETIIDILKEKALSKKTD